MELPDTNKLCLLTIVTIFTVVTYRWLLDGRAAPPATEAPRLERPPKDGRTFRVRGVPSDWNADRLQSFLGGLDVRTSPTVKSLAHEIHARSNTGTVTFQNVPRPLQMLPAHQSWRISLSKPSETQPARDQQLTVEDDFFGITTLYAPAPEDHKVDIVAISGLGGHAFGSFKERDGDHMWLRDSLPNDLTWESTDRRMARVMIYGYESTVAQSKSVQNLEDLATSFHNSLLVLVSTLTTLPIILVAHSLGGLIVKQTLISLSKSKNEDDKRLIRAVYGIVFLGVPHDGMDISSLIPMVGNGPNRFLIESIGRINSQILSIQQREFYTALGGEGDSEIVCFYETVESPTAQEGTTGGWAMTGPTAILVTKSSATHCRVWEDGPEHICAVARTHSDMVKFTPQDHEYDKVRERLRGLARRAVTARRRILASNSKFLVPYIPNPDFVERPRILRELQLQFDYGQRSGPIKTRSRVSLYGLGGVGKTQIALAYVYRLQETCPDVSIFWVHANNAQRFRQGFAAIAQECDIPGYSDPKVDVLSLVKTWLEKKDRGRWLMVIDNADDTQVFFQRQRDANHATASNNATKVDGGLGRYIPECAHGSVLFTTRNKKTGLDLAWGARPIEVGRMTNGEADKLLRTILEDDAISVAETLLLSSRLEHLPLALAQAAAFVQGNCISISEYIQLLDKSDSSLVDRLSEAFQTVGRDSETPHAVAATWMISFEQIARQHSCTSEVLSLISLFDHQAIPKDFVTHYCHRRWPKDPEADTALGTLKAFSFISEREDRSVVDMHRLVQLVSRKWLTFKGRMVGFAQHALETVSDAYPYGRFENREICLKYLPHAYAVLENNGTGSRIEEIARASLLHRMAGYFLCQGQWKDAKQYQTKAVELRGRIIGEEHPDTLTSMSNLASMYLNQGQWKEAEKLGVRVIETRKRVLGEDHPDTLTSMSNLASTYLNQGRWKEAEALGARVIETRKRILGDEHPDTLTSMVNLASTYWDQGRWKEAEELEVRVMETRKRILGDEHPDTLTSMVNLASTYWDQGRWKEAEELEVRVMETRKRILGDEHPDTLTSMVNLASTYWDQGRWKEAEELEVRVMETRKRILGDEHPDTLTSMVNLASTYWDQGRWKEAEELEVRVMETRKRILGDEHPDTLTSMVNLASTYWDQGRWKEAEELEVRVMETRKRILGDEHPDTLTSMVNLASTYWDQGRWKEAEELEVRVMETRKRILGDEHPDTLTSMVNLASTYWDQGRWKEAEELEVRVMETRKRILGDEHPDTLTAMGNLAFTLKSQSRNEEALILMRTCLQMRERIIGRYHPDTESSLEALNEWQRENLEVEL